MFKVITEDKDAWDSVVKSFENWDVYYLYDYCLLLSEHGDGFPMLIYYEGELFRLCYTVLRSDIAKNKKFQDSLDMEKVFDFSTPYGYGGPLFEGLKDDAEIEFFFCELTAYCMKNNIVSQFIRFNPINNNYEYFEKLSEIRKLKTTIKMDLASEQVIVNNMTSKNRNMVRKAKKNEIIVDWDNGENIDEFIEIYRETMERNNATQYYYFSDEYFHKFNSLLSSNSKYFYARKQGKIISAAMVLYNSKHMHYHLSGTLKEYMSLAPTNLLIYDMALWGLKLGIKELHLGGGIEKEDSLFAFKKRFNINGEVDFHIGRNIFIPEKYDELVKLRRKMDPNFNDNNTMLIKYRG